MLRTRRWHTLGALVALFGTTLDAQMVGATAAPPVTVRPPSSLPPITMGSRLPQPGVTGHVGRGSGFGTGVSGCFDRFGCRDFGKVGRRFSAFDRLPYTVPAAVAYEVPVYVPVPVPVYSVAPLQTPKAPEKPYDPEKSRMLTIGAGADGGGGVMRIEAVSDSVVRLTWLGTTRRVREAKLFLADATQRPLRSALVDEGTPSALFKVADLAPRVAYYGLTITFANGAIETTLVPHQPGVRREP